MGAGFSSTNPHQYDVVIIGAGSAGLTAADFALKMGARVLLVEKEKVGGDCTWYGCVPSKAFIKCAKVAHHARHGRKYGVHVQNDEVSVDMKDVTAYVQAKIDEVYQHESPEALRKKGLQVMLGAASFIDHHTIKVVHPVPAPSPSSSSVDSKKDNDKADDLQSGTQHADQKNRLSGDEKHEHSFGNGATQTIVTASSFLICTGAKPRIPALEGIKTVPFITYEDVFSLERLPERLCVLGGGPIGAELAQAFSRLGSSVTMFARALMPKEQPGVRAVMDTVFAAEGIDVVGERAVKVSLNPANRKDQEEEMLDQKKNNGKDTYSQSRAGDGMTSITVSGDSKTSECDTLLVATGRVPNISELNLQAAGVQYTSKGIQVNDQLQTNQAHIYAAGDCTGGFQFTHYAGWQAFQAMRNILLPGSDKGVSNLCPWSTFTDPEVGKVGLTLKEAIEKYGEENVTECKWVNAKVDRSVVEDDGHGFVSLIVSKKKHVIIGATVVSARAGEAISELSVAIANKLTMKQVASAMHPYPAFNCAIQFIAAEYAINDLLFHTTTGRWLRSRYGSDQSEK